MGEKRRSCEPRRYKTLKLRQDERFIKLHYKLNYRFN